MATTPTDIAARRRVLFGDGTPANSGGTQSVLAGELQQALQRIERLEAENGILRGGILDELRREFRSAPPSPTPSPATGQVFELRDERGDVRQMAAPTMTPKGGPVPDHWLLETRDSMGNPRTVRLTPKFKT